MDSIKKFFLDWSPTIQAVSVLILVIATIWYAIRTHTMAVLMRREYNLRIRPYVKLENSIDRMFDTQQNPTSLLLQFHLRNVSAVPVGYYVESLTLNNVNLTPPAANVFMFPDQEIIYRSEDYVTGSIIQNSGDMLEGEIIFVFFGAEFPGIRYKFSRNFRLIPNTMALTLNETFLKV